EDEEGPTGDVERCARKSAVHGQVAGGVAADALLVADGLADRLAESNADIFHRVVEIDVQVALAGDIHVDERVARKLIEHVIEEADAGRHFMRAGAIEIDRDGNLGLVGLAGNGGGAHWKSLRGSGLTS